MVDKSFGYDPVDKPAHYNQGKVECIDAIEAATINKKGIEAVCTANVIKYVWRYETKNGLEDVKKARFYLQKIIDKLEEDESSRERSVSETNNRPSRAIGCLTKRKSPDDGNTNVSIR
jgi:hypothetical protein